MTLSASHPPKNTSPAHPQRGDEKFSQVKYENISETAEGQLDNETERATVQPWASLRYRDYSWLFITSLFETVWNRSDTKRLVPLDSNYSSTDRLALPLELQFPGGSIGKLGLDVSVSFLGYENLS